MFKNLMAITLFLMASAVYSQTTISGTIVDASGPVPGANILETGTSNGTTSDFNGKFSIQVQEGSGVLEITFVGMVTTEFAFTAVSGQDIDAGSITL